jgi:hypothetical protein
MQVSELGSLASCRIPAALDRFFVAGICGPSGLVQTNHQLRRLLIFPALGRAQAASVQREREAGCRKQADHPMSTICSSDKRVHRLGFAALPSPFDPRAEMGRRGEGGWIRLCTAQEQFMRPVIHVTGQRLAHWP